MSDEEWVDVTDQWIDVSDKYAAPAAQPSAVDRLKSQFLAGVDVAKDRLTNPDNYLRVATGAARGLGTVADLANSIGRMASFRSPIAPAEETPSTYLKSLLGALTGNSDVIDVGKDSSLGATGEMLAANLLIPGSGLVSTGVSSLGAGFGREFGGQTGEIAGSLLPAIPATARLVASLLPTTEKAQATIGKLASQYGITPEAIDRAIDVTDPLASVKSTAEVLRSPQLATLEQSIGAGPKAAEYAAATQARAAARDKLLAALSPAENIPREYTGQELQKVWNEASTAATDKATALYDRIPASVTPNMSDANKQIEAAAEKYFGEGAPEIPKGIRGRIDYLASNPGERIVDTGLLDATGNKITKTLPAEDKVTLGGLQRARSHLGDIATAAEKAGKNQEAALAHAMRQVISDTIENAPAGSAEWKAANEFYRKYMTQFGNGPLKNLPDVLPSAAFSKVMASPESSQQAMKVFGSSPDTVVLIKDQIASDFAKMTGPQRAKFVDKYSSQLKTLLGKDYGILEAISKDIRSQIDTATLANPTRGSNTALKLSDVVQRALTGKSAAKSGKWETLAKIIGAGGAFEAARAHPAVAIPVTLATLGAGALRNKSTAMVQQALYNALMNPGEMKNALTAFSSQSAPDLAPLVRALLPGAVNAAK